MRRSLEATVQQEPVVTPIPTVTDVPVMVPDTTEYEIDEEQLIMAARVEEASKSMDLIMRTVVAEAGNQGYDGMRAVAQVIYDRRYNSTYNFGNTFEEIIYAENQFCTPYSGDISPWYPDVLAACEAVFYCGDFVFDQPVHYFYVASKVSDSTLRWFETKQYVGTIGAHTFRSEGS